MVDTKLKLTVKLNIKRDQFALKTDMSLPLENMTACFGPSGAGKTGLPETMADPRRQIPCLS